jgi:hypothetical protein
MNTTNYLGFECNSIRKNSTKNQDLAKNFILENSFCDNFINGGGVFYRYIRNYK